MLSYFIYFLLFATPGIIAVLTYELVIGIRIMQSARFVGVSIVFDFLIFLPILIGLYFFKAVYTFAMLITYFECISFIIQYSLLAIFMAAITGLLVGFLDRATNRRRFF